MKPQFMIDRNGKMFCLYAGLLDEAHAQGLSSIRTQIVQIPTNDNGNVAIVQATVTTEKGEFQGIGDASPQNVARAMLTCLIRMAETRAKARALRDAVNVGAAALEKLDSEGRSDNDDPSPTTHGPGAQQAASVPPAGVAPRTGSPSAQAGSQAAHITPEPSPGTDPMTSAQRRMIEALAKASGQTVNFNGLTRSEASQVISNMKAQAQKKAS
ncbi:MAG: DUF3072 domain-containing protein [Armatimonadota bacterium]|nr:DUF3072 domain-containing protein [Armatimonadota bacterium]